MKRIMIGALLAAVVAGSSVWAAGGAGRAAASTQRPTLLAHVTVTLSDSKIVLNQKSAKRGLVVFKVTNVGSRQHNFAIDRRKTKLLSHGKSATLRVTFLRKGAYPYKSTQSGDAAKGLKGVFTIK